MASFKRNITEQGMAKLKESVQERDLKVEQFINFASYDEVMKDNREALKELFHGDSIKTPRFNQCKLIPGNAASLVEYEGNIFYKSEDSNTYYFLNIFNMYSLFFNGSYGEIITDILNRFKIITDEEKWKTEQRERYIYNLKKMEQMEEWVDNYPFLNKLIMSQVDLLESMNREGMKNVIGNQHQANGVSIFFSSVRYLSRLTGNNNSNTSRAISMMSLLKLIDKVNIEKIPEDMWYRTEKSKKATYPAIGYFTIEKMTKEILDRAEKIAKQAIENGIRLSSISYESIKDSMGQEDANRVFGNNINHIQWVKNAKSKRFVFEPVYDLGF